MTPYASQNNEVVMAGFTRIQRKILKLLSDGLPHRPAELQQCLYDTETSLAGVRVHLTLLRKKLRPNGEDIICEYINRSYRYRHVRLLQQEE